MYGVLVASNDIHCVERVVACVSVFGVAHNGLAAVAHQLRDAGLSTCGYDLNNFESSTNTATFETKHNGHMYFRRPSHLWL